jgi:hypothetical protein
VFVSGIWGYYLIYFLLTFLFYILIRKKIHFSRTTALLLCGAIVLGMVAPFAISLFGRILGFLFLTGGAMALSFLFIAYKAKQQQDLLEEEQENMMYPEEEVRETASLPSAQEHEMAPLVFSKESEEESDQEQVDRLLARLLSEQTDSRQEEVSVSAIVGIETEDREMEEAKTDDSLLSLEDIFKDEDEQKEEIEDGHKEEIKEEVPVYHFTGEAEEKERLAEEEVTTASMEEEIYYSNLQEIVEEESEQEKQDDFILEISLEDVEKNEPEETVIDAAEASDIDGNEGSEWEFELEEDTPKTSMVEDMAKVQQHFLAANAALADKNYEDALFSLKQALDYRMPFAAMLMITEDYIKVLREMGLYKHSIQALQNLLACLETTELDEKQRSRYTLDIINQIRYIETLMDLLRIEGKTNLPWSLIPSSIHEEAEQKANREI